MATADQITALFWDTGTDINWGMTGTETAEERAERIAEEVNSGQRTMGSVGSSLSWIRDQGGVTTQSTPEGGWDTIRTIYGWLPEDALKVFYDAYVESGNSDAAWATAQQDPRYEQWFPGNLTEDGRPRYEESKYAAVVASYDDVFRAVGFGEAAIEEMRAQYGNLIRGEVAPQELEQNRIMPMYERIVEGSADIKKWYSENYGLELTTQALLAGAINPDLGHKILTKQISMAEIGGEAKESGFGIQADYAEQLYEAGLTKQAADKMFQSAESFLPVLNVLSARHADPDDDFDLEEFVSADLFGGPMQRRRMNRLVAQERSSFSGGQLGAGAAQSRATGGLTGLTER